ncbi:non-specific lipid-transfer protein-like [Papaver somniferum]|uniref:non-specific lipid-transfer protein-like n=1 Tax=Papaver somniferum TaxID=3469 RepID=UPI000E702966|nr:non-specific lipid-transfer protein-like [Papaver somniferum]
MAAVFKLVCVLLAFMVVSAPYAAEGALTCGQVASKMTPCLGFLLGNPMSPGCCPGVKGLLAMAKSTPDRQAACNCLKGAAKSMSGINMAKAAALPKQCGVNIPYQISPATDCAKVK